MVYKVCSSNPAGELSSFKGKKDGRDYSYLEQNGYDQFGHLIYQKMGNGTRQEYTYEPVRQRLQEMKLYTGDSLLMHNQYAYDAVDNILSIQNDTLSRHAYSYDDLNRLITAVGRASSPSGRTGGGASYTLGMSYDLMGKPTRKNQMTQGSNATTHDWAYAYTGSKPNAVTQIGTKIYTYDGNGNPTGWEDGEKYRRMAWDEENRLTAVDDNAYLSRYVYDHTGERVVKTHSGSSGIMVNGVSQGTLTHNENTTLYVSPYFTVGKNGNEFTKHYYAGSQRLASKLGNGRFNNYFRPGIYGLTAGGVNYIERMQSIAQSKEDYMKNNGIAPGPPHMKGIYADPNFSGISYPDGGTPSNTYVPVGWPRKVIPLKDKDPNGAPGAPIQYYPTISNETVEPGFAYEGGGQIEESGRFFYHSDHLGSTGYVTDARGRVSQYVAYMPYGETLYEQHSSTREMPYLFNGKERDEETGLYYYGARYYDAEATVWMGVDPMWVKHPDYSPFVYVLSNPLRYADPTGMTEEERNSAISFMRSILGSKNYDCSGAVGAAVVNAGLPNPNRGTSYDGWGNGVALIAGTTTKVNNSEMRTGDMATFRSGRSDHMGEDGKYDHIGLITKVEKNKDGSIKSFDVIHKTSSKGIYEQTYDMKNGMSGFELRGVYQWDTPETTSSASEARASQPMRSAQEKIRAASSGSSMSFKDYQSLGKNHPGLFMLSVLGAGSDRVQKTQARRLLKTYGIAVP